MAVVGIIGQERELFVRFYENGVLFNPFDILDVNIYDAETGGTLIAGPLTPQLVNVGQYKVIWDIPDTVVAGRYYHEWTWQAVASIGTKTQRYIVDVVPPSITTSPKRDTNCNLAVGWWGRDLQCRIEGEQIPCKIKTLLGDKLLSRGKDVYLWQQVTESTAGVEICSCVKDTTQRADITCSSCYGVKLIPGYIKFGHETIFSSSTSSSLTLTNTELNMDIKPYRILLSPTQLTGTIESGAIPYSNAISANWGYRLDAANILDTNSINVEFSTNNIDFYPISELNDSGKIPIGTGNIYLRITMARANAEDRSPEFEIIRLRHANTEQPFIKILRPQVSEFPSIMQYGRRSEFIGERFWTMPLDFFDENIQADTPAARIVENSFYERVTGINVGNRFVTTKLNYNEEFGTFTEQSFEVRRVQPEEVYARLVF